ncbi:hypothetical protein [Companilactobacillus jidongensis]|uniref:hypothetical protein n=1 Tax=Companilactobacillus jidongensis TaxID=2486006 RepID=UPI000F79BA3C|nr:hypothetical protein [Companilactobacillus jidongensis]
MKFYNSFSSKVLVIFFLLITIVISLQSTQVDAATFGSPITIDKNSNNPSASANTSASTADIATKKTLAITDQANQQSITDVVTQFSSPITTVTNTNQTTLLNSLISPLAIYNKVTTGDVNVNGYYIEADVGYLFSTIQNDVNVANTTTISLKSIHPNASGTASSWTIQRGYDSPVSSSKLGKSAKLPGYGDIITMSSDTTATLVGSSTQTNNIYTNMPINGAIEITAEVTNNMPAELELSLGGVVDSSDYVPHADINTLMHFNIRENIFDEVYEAMKSYSPDLKSFSVTGFHLHWIRDYRKNGFEEESPTLISDDVIDVLDGYDPADLKTEYLLYKQDGPNSDIEDAFMNGVYAKLVLDYTYKAGILSTTRTGQLVTNFGGLIVEYTSTPTTSDKLPEVKLDNEIHNLTNTDSDSPDTDGKYLAVKNVKKDDSIQYTANLNSTYDNSGENSGTISKSVYTVSIPKGMDIDTNSVEFTNDDGVVSTIDSSYVNIVTDPDDSTKQVLTVSNINLDPDGIANANFKLVFNGTVTDDNQDDFTFTPTFKGIGGYENGDTSKPMYVDADGKEQLINFDRTVEPGGGITLKPMDIDFGSFNTFVTTDVLRHRVNNDDSPVLAVQDDRSDSDKNSQTISVEQKGDLTNGTVTFPGELRFYDPDSSTDEFTSLLTGGAVPIYVSKNGETMSSISWAKDKGLLLHVNGADTAIPSGKYTTQLDWTISDTI